MSSIQYKLAKAAMKIKCSPSSDAILSELGWLNINDAMDIKRIAYFQYLQRLEEQRLPKIVLHQLVKIDCETPFQYTSNIKEIFVKNGADFMFDSPAKLSESMSVFKRLLSQRYTKDFNTAIQNQSSLKYFKMFKDNTYCSEYTKSRCSFKGIQLKFKLRTGVLSTGKS